MKQLIGTGVALVTPFDATGKIDFKSLKKLLAHTAKGVDYYVVMGTTGESVTLTLEEKKQVLEFVKKNNPAKLPIVYGIGGNNTQQVLETIKAADLKGVVALLSVSPYYNKPSQEGVIQHFKLIADNSPLPIILYNVPGRTASNISADTTLRLAQHKNIMGIKEASGNIEQCMKILRDKPKDFLLISGDDMLTTVLYAMGAKGVISVLANAVPGTFRKIKEYAFAGNFSRASQYQLSLLELNGPMYEEANPVGLKYLLKEIGICEKFVRMPLLPATEQLQRKIRAAYTVYKKKRG